jgi:arylsulfatase A
VPEDRAIDGRDIWPLVAGEPGAKSPHEAYFLYGRAVRAGKWKLHLPGARVTVAEKGAAGEKAEPLPLLLFDLSEDISETRNVAEEHPEVVARLGKLLEEHNAEIRRNRRPVGKVLADREP